MNEKIILLENEHSFSIIAVVKHLKWIIKLIRNHVSLLFFFNYIVFVVVVCAEYVIGFERSKKKKRINIFVVCSVSECRAM